MVNFVLKPHDKLWGGIYLPLVAFRQWEGHCRVEDERKVNGVTLGKRVGKQRTKAASLADRLI